MPRILFVSGFHPSTRAKDLAYEFERSVALPFVLRPPSPPYPGTALSSAATSPPRATPTPTPTRKSLSSAVSTLFVALVESPSRSPPVPRNTSPASSSHPRSRPRNRPRAAPRRVESSPEPPRAFLVEHKHASSDDPALIRFPPVRASRPRSTRAQRLLRSYAFVEFRSQRDAEDAYYDMYVPYPRLAPCPAALTAYLP